MLTMVICGIFMGSMPIARAVEPEEGLPPVGEPAVDAETAVPGVDLGTTDILGGDGAEEATIEELVEDYAREKFLKEQERKVQAQQFAREAERNMNMTLYKVAYGQYQKAVEYDPANKKYLAGLEKALMLYLKDLMTQKKYDRVISIAGGVLAEEPSNTEVEELWLQAMREKRQAVLAPPTPGIEQMVEKAEEMITDEMLVEEARALMEKKLYIDAKDILEDAHELNLFNVEVDRLIDECNYRIMLAHRDRREALRLEAIADVSKRWGDRPRRKLKPEEYIKPLHPSISPRKQEIMEKLDLIVDEVSFENATLDAVLDWIRDSADLPILVDPSVYAAAPAPEAAEEFGPPGFEEMYEEGPPGFEETVPPVGPGAGAPGTMFSPTSVPYSNVKAADITLRLNKLPIREFLRYVLIQKNLTYRVDDYAVVVIRPGTVRVEEMQTEIFRLSLGGLGAPLNLVSPVGATLGRTQSTRGGGRLGGGAFGAGAAAGTAPSAPSNIKDFLLNSGIPWPAGSNINYIPSAGVVMVTNTPTHLATIRELINIWNQPPLQVEIEARFVSITLDKRNEGRL